MKIDYIAFCLVLPFVASFARGEEAKAGEIDPLIASLENLVSKVQRMKTRVEKTLNDTAAEAISYSRKDFLKAKGYSFTSGVGYHKLYRLEFNWHDALHFCRKENAYLAVVNSADEATAIGNLVKDRLPTELVPQSEAYVGIHDYAKNGSWITIFFDSLSNADYLQWKNGSTIADLDENCAVIDEKGQLSKLKCSTRRAFVCEAEL